MSLLGSSDSREEAPAKANVMVEIYSHAHSSTRKMKLAEARSVEAHQHWTVSDSPDRIKTPDLAPNSGKKCTSY